MLVYALFVSDPHHLLFFNPNSIGVKYSLIIWGSIYKLGIFCQIFGLVYALLVSDRHHLLLFNKETMAPPVDPRGPFLPPSGVKLAEELFVWEQGGASTGPDGLECLTAPDWY